MKKSSYPCHLCGQPVKIAGFKLSNHKGSKHFCCEGCLRIYQLLEPEQTLTKPSAEKTS